MRSIRKSRQDRAGFTLVELVVVIVILGILAGVAYGGYTKYIEYTRRSGDEDYIASVNEAFAAACVDQGVDRETMNSRDAAADFPDSKNEKEAVTINSITAASLGNGNGKAEFTDDRLNDFRASFNSYFKDNETEKLKYYTSDQIIFQGGTKLFGTLGGSVSESKNKFYQSSYGNNPDSFVDHMSSYVQAWFGSATADNGALRKAMNSYGLRGMLQEAMNEGLLGNNQDIDALVEELKGVGMPEDTTDAKDVAEALSKLMMKRTAEMSPDEIKQRMQNVKDQKSVKDFDDPITDIPMKLAMMESYVNSGYASEEYVHYYNLMTKKLSEGHIGFNVAFGFADPTWDDDKDYNYKKLWDLASDPGNGTGGPADFFASDAFQNDMDAYYSAYQSVWQQGSNADIADGDAFADLVTGWLNGST